MSTQNQTSNILSPGKLGSKFGDLLFTRQPAVLGAKTHKSLVASLSSRLGAWRERRLAAAELASLSDRELADIGVSRHEIPEVVYGRK